MSKWIKGDSPRSKKSKWYQVTLSDGHVCLNYWYAENKFWKTSFSDYDGRHYPIIAYANIDYLKSYKGNK